MRRLDGLGGLGGRFAVDGVAFAVAIASESVREVRGGEGRAEVGPESGGERLGERWKECWGMGVLYSLGV